MRLLILATSLLVLISTAKSQPPSDASIYRFEDSCSRLVFEPTKKTGQLVADCAKASKPTCEIARTRLREAGMSVSDFACNGPSQLPEVTKEPSHPYEDACHKLIFGIRGQQNDFLLACSKASRSTCELARRRIAARTGSDGGLTCVGPGDEPPAFK